MSDPLLFILALLYAAAAISLHRSRRMPSRIIAMLVIPLALQAIFYMAAIFFDMPHWAVAIGQSLYLVAILAIDFFEGRKDKQ